MDLHHFQNKRSISLFETNHFLRLRYFRNGIFSKVAAGRVNQSQPRLWMAKRVAAEFQIFRYGSVVKDAAQSPRDVVPNRKSFWEIPYLVPCRVDETRFQSLTGNFGRFRAIYAVTLLRERAKRRNRRNKSVKILFSILSREIRPLFFAPV